MTTTTVTNQDELNTALTAKAELIYIESPAGVWLTLRDSGSSQVVAWGSSKVVAWGSSKVVAWDSSQVVARDSSQVVAWGSSQVDAWGSSQVVARDSSKVVARDSSKVDARDSSKVDAWGSSKVVAWGSSKVVAWGSSQVDAWGSSQVVAWDSSQVVAWDSSQVVAWGSSKVDAGKYVAVHLHSQRVTLSGGVVIDMTAIDHDDPQTWIDLHGGKIADGRVTVYKGVDANLTSKYGATYPVGETVACPDWKTTKECGNGLHFSPSPISTEMYCAPVRYLECTVELTSMIPLGDKIKAPSCVVVREVDRWGDPIAVDTSKAGAS